MNGQPDRFVEPPGASGFKVASFIDEREGESLTWGLYANEGEGEIWRWEFVYEDGVAIADPGDDATAVIEPVASRSIRMNGGKESIAVYDLQGRQVNALYRDNAKHNAGVYMTEVKSAAAMRRKIRFLPY
jgi:hypothetical protein